jgi:hypothetical protein
MTPSTWSLPGSKFIHPFIQSSWALCHTEASISKNQGENGTHKEYYRAQGGHSAQVEGKEGGTKLSVTR